MLAPFPTNLRDPNKPPRSGSTSPITPRKSATTPKPKPTKSKSKDKQLSATSRFLRRANSTNPDGISPEPSSSWLKPAFLRPPQSSPSSKSTSPFQNKSQLQLPPGLGRGSAGIPSSSSSASLTRSMSARASGERIRGDRDHDSSSPGSYLYRPNPNLRDGARAPSPGGASSISSRRTRPTSLTLSLSLDMVRRHGFAPDEDADGEDDEDEDVDADGDRDEDEDVPEDGDADGDEAGDAVDELSAAYHRSSRSSSSPVAARKSRSATAPVGRVGWESAPASGWGSGGGGGGWMSATTATTTEDEVDGDGGEDSPIDPEFLPEARPRSSVSVASVPSSSQHASLLKAAALSGPLSASADYGYGGAAARPRTSSSIDSSGNNSHYHASSFNMNMSSDALSMRTWASALASAEDGRDGFYSHTPIGSATSLTRGTSLSVGSSPLLELRESPLKINPNTSGTGSPPPRPPRHPQHVLSGSANPSPVSSPFPDTPSSAGGAKDKPSLPFLLRRRTISASSNSKAPPPLSALRSQSGPQVQSQTHAQSSSSATASASPTLTSPSSLASLRTPFRKRRAPSAGPAPSAFSSFLRPGSPTSTGGGGSNSRSPSPQQPRPFPSSSPLPSDQSRSSIPPSPTPSHGAHGKALSLPLTAITTGPASPGLATLQETVPRSSSPAPMRTRSQYEEKTQEQEEPFRTGAAAKTRPRTAPQARSQSQFQEQEHAHLMHPLLRVHHRVLTQAAAAPNKNQYQNQALPPPPPVSATQQQQHGSPGPAPGPGTTAPRFNTTDRAILSSLRATLDARALQFALKGPLLVPRPGGEPGCAVASQRASADASTAVTPRTEAGEYVFVKHTANGRDLAAGAVGAGGDTGAGMGMGGADGMSTGPVGEGAPSAAHVLNVHGGFDASQRMHHPEPRRAAPYPRSYERAVVDLDVWETLWARQICGSLTWHVFETPPAKVLDIGCGTGTWIMECARVWKDSHFVGLDVVPLHPNLNTIGSGLSARIKWEQHNFLEGLPFPNEEFDYVHIKRIARGVPEDKWDDLFEEITRVMKPGAALEIIEDDLSFPGKTNEGEDAHVESDSEAHDSKASQRHEDTSASDAYTETTSLFSSSKASVSSLTPGPEAAEVGIARGDEAADGEETDSIPGLAYLDGSPVSSRFSRRMSVGSATSSIAHQMGMTGLRRSLSGRAPPSSGRQQQQQQQQSQQEKPPKPILRARSFTLSSSHVRIQPTSDTEKEREHLERERRKAKRESAGSDSGLAIDRGRRYNGDSARASRTGKRPATSPGASSSERQQQVVVHPPTRHSSLSVPNALVKSASSPASTGSPTVPPLPFLSPASASSSPAIPHAQAPVGKRPSTAGSAVSVVSASARSTKSAKAGMNAAAQAVISDIDVNPPMFAAYPGARKRKASTSAGGDRATSAAAAATTAVVAPSSSSGRMRLSVDTRSVASGGTSVNLLRKARRTGASIGGESASEGKSSGDHHPDRVSDAGAAVNATVTGPPPPPNPRDHTVLETIYNEMHASRFVNLTPLSLLANTMGLYFKDVRTHPPIVFKFPPPRTSPTGEPLSPPPPQRQQQQQQRSHDADDGEDTQTSATPTASAFKPGPGPRRLAAAPWDPDRQTIISQLELLMGACPYVSLDDVRFTAFSPSHKASFNQLLSGNKSREGSTVGASDGGPGSPRSTASTLGDMSALSALAGAEGGSAVGSPSVSPANLALFKTRLPNDKLEIDLRTLPLHLHLRVKEIVSCAEAMWEWVEWYQTEGCQPGKGLSASASIDNVGVGQQIGELTRAEFDALLVRFEIDMREHIAVGSGLENRFGWMAPTGPPPYEKQVFDNMCARWREYAASADASSQGPDPGLQPPWARLSRSLRVFVAWKP
ncbi:hypothetical protein CONPUDRAFT_165259 [Coniophora puteana RWD-64-598 SS2]|uniref:Methyltransferase domain-containing protein n=1 Tax=Coniophora puteana (strain RWD-64-598) TaxID=741705 RepID=A0A5M3MPC8_CONPW|nr:uncharacterized protein CONPUDRAFT_165259 [Coniophora puteana RWD-64-598 SS2]EIW81029.1 hypothetical protein CONPUDRAFT_165259 [Coniophora puteana RWD-64-598 SS2]